MAYNNKIRTVARTKWRKEQIFAMVVACIPLLGFIIFNGFPLIISFIGMFCNVDLYDLSNIQWNDFEGFKSVFVPRHAYDLFYFDLSKYFYKAILITLWIASTQLVTLLIALVIATLLREKPNGAKLFQILFFIPYICSTVAVSLMWRWILDWEGGILNSILGTDIKWLEDPTTITWCIILAIIWQAPGYGIVMYKAAFSNINNNLYEAAELDGANVWQQYTKITLPYMLFVTGPSLLTSFINNLNNFNVIYLLTNGGNPINTQIGSAGGVSVGHTDLLITWLYKIALGSGESRYYTASVIGILIFVVCAVLSLIVYNVIPSTKNEEDYQ